MIELYVALEYISQKFIKHFLFSGKRYGKLKLQTALAALLSNFRVTVDKKTEEPIKLSPTAFVPVAIGLFLNFERLPH